MSSRVAGAGLALIAVALLAVSLVTPVVLPGQLSLFAGHPTVSGHTRETQEVYVGLYTARLCNSGGDGTCKSGDATTGFRLTGYAELGATGLLAFAAGLLALLTLRKSEGRKAMARLVWIAGAVAAAAGVGLILQGPFRGASVPIGLGMALHGAGIVGAMLAGAIAVRPPPPLRLRVGDRGSQPLAALPSAQAFSLRGTGPAGAPRGAAREAFGDASGGFDRRVLRDDGQLRPADPRPEPRAGVDGRMRPPAAVEPAPPAGFAAPQPASERPLFSSAPQLRPLYDAAPTQGGTGGLLPIERPVIPTGPLTPVPRAAMSAVVGLQDPAGGDESRIAQPPLFSDEPRSAPLFSDEPRPARPKAASLPPPLPLAATASAGPAPLAAPPSPFAAASPPPLPFAAAPLPFAASPPPSPFAEPTGSLPRTQIAPVPPMPEAIARPAAQAAASGAWPAGSSPATNPSASPRPETPLAEPPAPPSAGVPPAPASAPPLPARAHRESQLPMPRRGVPPTRPPLRATVPMPARPSGSGTIPPRLTMPTPLRDAPPRPTITAPVPPIPAIPPIPPPLRAETDVTADEAAAGLGAASPETRVPVEVGDDISQTNVSVDLPVPEVEAASSGGADGAGEPSDTSPSGEPVAGAAAGTSGTQPLAPASATSAPEPATSAASAPQVRDRPMPKLPISTAPDSLPPPRDNKQAIGPSPACPQCESPMAWVEEHLRFYCKSCRMYF